MSRSPWSRSVVTFHNVQELISTFNGDFGCFFGFFCDGEGAAGVASTGSVRSHVGSTTFASSFRVDGEGHPLLGVGASPLS